MLEGNRGRDKAPGAALVTGAGRGIGAAVARALAADGRAVCLVARSVQELDRVRGLISHEGGRAVSVEADLAEPGEAERVAREAEQRLGEPLGAVVSNAATVHPVERLLDAPPSAWWRTQEVNVRAPMELLHAVLPGMLERGDGVVVGIGSLLAALPLPGVSAYCASKSAFEALHLSVAQELIGSGVRVVTLWPGTVDTVMQAEIRKEPVEVVGHRTGSTMRTPEDVAAVVGRLCAPDCRATGVRVDLDDPASLALLEQAGASA